MKFIFTFTFALIAVCAVHLAAAEYIPQEILCPEYEVWYPCGDSCQTECATLDQPCLIRHIRCPDGCYCVEGYARDSSGKCIPVDQC